MINIRLIKVSKEKNNEIFNSVTRPVFNIN